MDAKQVDRNVLLVCRDITRKLTTQGAEAVVLFGSRARGDAYEESDIDLQAIGRGPNYRLERHQRYLVSIAWKTARQHCQAFKDPGMVGGIVPAWRNAVVIHDPRGIALNIKNDAETWCWESLGKEADRWVAEETTGYAEEVHRLIGNLKLGRRSAAAVVRSALAIKMAPILAVHHRILYDTENQLWSLVATRMGTHWAQIQRSALGEHGQSFEDTCESALQLYAAVAHEVGDLLNPQQFRVVAYACKLAGNPLTPRNRTGNGRRGGVTKRP